jgi:hypothetical protein
MKRFLIWFSIILIIFLSGFVYWRYFYTYSEGYRAGMLQKFSYRGTFFKTYEGEIILSTITSTKDVTLASEKFFFSVTDKPVAEQFSSLEGRLVVVHYKEKLGRLFWQGDSRYIVDSVKLQQEP